jgi:ABC-2 type transport system ATP-binding protein
MAALAAGLSALGAAGVDPEDLSVRRPTLDEVFLRLTEPATDPAEVSG